MPMASQVVLVVNKPSAIAGDMRDLGSTSGLGRSPRGGPSNPLQYSCLENFMDRGAWWARVHRVAKGWTQIKRLHEHVCVRTRARTHTHTHTHVYTQYAHKELIKGLGK